MGKKKPAPAPRAQAFTAPSDKEPSPVGALVFRWLALIKRLTMWRTRRGVSREAALDYWRTSHVHLVEQVPGVKRYVQDHCIVGPDGSEPPYVGVGELGFEDVETAQGGAHDARVAGRHRGRFNLHGSRSRDRRVGRGTSDLLRRGFSWRRAAGSAGQERRRGGERQAGQELGRGTVRTVGAVHGANCICVTCIRRRAGEARRAERCQQATPSCDAHRVRASCGHALDAVVSLQNENPRVCGGFRGGRYWARTSDPQLVDSGQAFAPVRSGALKQHGLSGFSD